MDSLIDIDLNVSGQILITGVSGTLYNTSTAMTSQTAFRVGTTAAFVSFGRHQSLPTGDVLVQLTNSDPTAITLPSSVVIPVGQRSVTMLIDPVDDKSWMELRLPRSLPLLPTTTERRRVP